MTSKAQAALGRYQAADEHADEYDFLMGYQEGYSDGKSEGYNQALADVLEWAEKNKWTEIFAASEVVDLKDLKKFAGGEDVSS